MTTRVKSRVFSENRVKSRIPNPKISRNKLAQLQQQIMIFWGPVVGLWIIQVIAIGPVYFGLFRIRISGLDPIFEKGSGFDPGCFI